MAKFKVGDRVRILWSNSWPELAGKDGVIEAASPSRGALGTSDWLVAPSEWGTHMAPYPGIIGGDCFGPNSSQLEPILYNGAQPSEFSYSELMDNLRTKVQEEV